MRLRPVIISEKPHPLVASAAGVLHSSSKAACRSKVLSHPQDSDSMSCELTEFRRGITASVVNQNNLFEGQDLGSEGVDDPAKQLRSITSHYDCGNGHVSRIQDVSPKSMNEERSRPSSELSRLSRAWIAFRVALRNAVGWLSFLRGGFISDSDAKVETPTQRRARRYPAVVGSSPATQVITQQSGMASTALNRGTSLRYARVPHRKSVG